MLCCCLLFLCVDSWLVKRKRMMMMRMMMTMTAIVVLKEESAAVDLAVRGESLFLFFVCVRFASLFLSPHAFHSAFFLSRQVILSFHIPSFSFVLSLLSIFHHLVHQFYYHHSYQHKINHPDPHDGDLWLSYDQLMITISDHTILWTIIIEAQQK